MNDTGKHNFPMIAEAATRAGTPAEVRDGRLLVGGYDMVYYLDYRKQAAKTLFLSGQQEARRKAPYYFSVGSIGKRTVYRQKSDGSFNWDGIAEKLIDIAQEKGRAAERADKTSTNKPVADELTERLGLSSYSGPMQISPSQYRTDLPLVVKIEISASADVARAEEIYMGLVALGLIKPRKA